MPGMSVSSEKLLDKVITVLALCAALYHLSSVYFHFQSSLQYLNTHLFFALLISGILMFKRWPRFFPLWLAFLCASIAGTLYVELNLQGLEMRSGYPTTPDMYVGVLLVIVTVVGSWWAFGLSIPLMILFFIVYALFGFLIPGYFNIPRPHLPRLISHLSIGLTGVYGTTLAASAHYIFLFVVFGALLQVSKAVDMFGELGKVISKGTRGGPAHACIVSSTLIGMITGSSAANAALGGGVTIPIMRQSGYSAVQAAAFESAASQGGQIMPPVMGAAAFIMAEMTGVSYSQIAIIAFVPALLFFLSIGIAVELRGRKLHASAAPVQIDRHKLFTGLPLFILPVAILIALFMLGYSANYAAFWGIFGLFAVAYARKETRIPLPLLLQGLRRGVVAGVQIALACAAVGIVVSVMTTTGLTVKIPKFIEIASMNNLWLAMVLMMIISLAIGTGLPTLPTYLIVALVTAPVLVQMGVPLLAAHFAAFYFAIFEGVTPPYGSTVIVAVGISGADLMKTYVEGMKVCLSGLILPFLWVVNPVLLNIFSNPLLALIVVLSVLALMISINAAFVDFYFIELRRWERWLAIISAPSLVIPLALANYSLLALGAVPFVFLTASQFLRSRRIQTRGALTTG